MARKATCAAAPYKPQFVSSTRWWSVEGQGFPTQYFMIYRQIFTIYF